MGSVTRPGHVDTGESPLQLVPITLGESVQEGRSLAAEVGQRFEHRRIRPGALDRGGDPTADPETELPGPVGSGGHQRRLPHARRPGHDHDRPSPTGGVVERVTQNAELPVPSHQTFRTTGNELVVTEEAISQLDGIRSGGHPELSPESALHPLELPEGGMAVAIGRGAAHEGEVGELVDRLELDNGLPPLEQAQQIEVAQAHHLATGLRPRLVEVVGQEVTPVDVERVLCCDRVAIGERPRGERVEPVDVHRDLDVGEQHDPFVAQHDGVRPVEGPAHVVRGLVQLRRGPIDRVVGPEGVDDKLPVQRPVGHRPRAA